MSGKHKLLSFTESLSWLPEAGGVVWKAAGVRSIGWLALLLIQGLLPALLVQLLRLFVDGLVAAIQAGGSWEAVRPAISIGAALAAVMLATEVLSGLAQWLRTAVAELIQDHISALIQRQATVLDLAYYESSEFHDRLNRAVSESGTRPMMVLETLGRLLQNTVTLLAMAAVLIPYGAWLPAALFAGTLPALYVIVRINRQYHSWWERLTEVRRRAQYYDQVLTTSWTASEVRLLGLGPHFRNAYQRLRRTLREGRLAIIRKQVMGRMLAAVVGLAVFGGTMAWMVWRALQGTATLGDLALFYQALNRGQSLMRSLLTDVGQVYTSGLFLSNLFEFLHLQPKVTTPAVPAGLPGTLEQGIHFDNVTFYYPDSRRPALDRLNLFVPAGQTVAIVGANGAGKSTLIKLLCRLYDPSSGTVRFDGVDLRRVAPATIHRYVSVQFQMPVAYHETVGDNIAFGDATRRPSRAEIETAVRRAGAGPVVDRLANGYDTLLGKRFANGTELSSGEWQRLASARCFLRDSQILVLDEPTSFVDSLSEAEWFDGFAEHVRSRTAVLVTHRLGIAKRADVIHVMDHGQIIESGTHDQLLARRGLYARSWDTQLRTGAHLVA